MEDIVSEGPGSITAKEKQVVAGRGQWRNGRWSAVLARSLKTPEPIDFQFVPAIRNRMAFAIWDGSRGEKGSRKSISEWVELDLAPVAVAANTTKESKP